MAGPPKTPARQSARSGGSPRRGLLAGAGRGGTPAVCVLTRDEAIPKLQNVVVALITRTIRGIETEIQLDASDGMPRECAISLDNLRTVPKALLVEPITELSAGKMNEVCRGLETATGCR